MAILVTGGAGFIATALIRQLLSVGETVVCFDNLTRGSLENLTEFGNNPALLFREVDVSDLDCHRFAICRIHPQTPITEVWHLAANSDIPAGVRNPDVDLRDTFMTTFNTLKVMDEFGIPAIYFASSSAVYGDLGDTLLSEETGPLSPISNYGAMKLASEAAIAAAAEKFLKKALILRFPNVVGVPATHGILLDFITRLRQTPDYLQVLGNGMQRKPYLHVTDLIDAMLFIKKRSAAKLDIFNIGPPDEGILVRRIAEEVVSIVAPRAEIRYQSGDKGWPGDVPRFRYSTAKLERLGWAPSLDSLASIQRAAIEVAHQVSGSPAGL